MQNSRRRSQTGWTAPTCSRIPEFIVLFEAALNRRLAVRQQITSATQTVNGGLHTLPTDYLMWKRVTWLGNPTRDLEYVTPSFLAIQRRRHQRQSDVFHHRGLDAQGRPARQHQFDAALCAESPAACDDGPELAPDRASRRLSVRHARGGQDVHDRDDNRGGALSEFKLTVEGIVDDLNKLTFSQTGAASSAHLGPNP
jgi:hypothetical protein